MSLNPSHQLVECKQASCDPFRWKDARKIQTAWDMRPNIEFNLKFKVLLCSCTKWLSEYKSHGTAISSCGSGELRCAFTPAGRERADESLTSLQEVPAGRGLVPNFTKSAQPVGPGLTPERRGASGRTNFWVQLSLISGQLPVTAAHNTTGKRDAGQPPFARFWPLSSMCWRL